MRQAAKCAFLAKDIPHNLIVVSELVDARCRVHMYFWGFVIDYKGDTTFKGWRERERERGSRLFRRNLDDTGGNRITPTVDPSKYSVDKSAICPTQQR